MKYKNIVVLQQKTLQAITIKAGNLLLLLLLLITFGANAQVFNPTSTTETVYPTSVAVPTTGGIPGPGAVPGLYCNARESIAFGTAPGGGNYFPEVSAWSEPASIWEDGKVAYGYTDLSGTYVGVGSITIPGAKHISAAYMESGGNAFILVAYTVQHLAYSNPDPARPCSWWPVTPTAYFYGQEYQIYDWPSATSTAIFNNRKRISTPGLFYASCHPLAPDFAADFSCDGTLVMDVNYDKDKVAFSWTGNCAGVMCTAGMLSAGGTLSMGRIGIAPYPSAHPADVAFRRDPASGLDYIHTLIPDGMGSYYVVQDEFFYVYNGGIGIPEVIDDETYISPNRTGTSLGGGMVDHVKLDVPDVSSERRWAYTWSDGANIYLRRFVAPLSSSPGTPIGSSTTEIITNGSMMASPPSSALITAINSSINELPAISYQQDVLVNRQQIAWRTNANMTTTGTFNWVAVEVEEVAPWPAPVRVNNVLDYLDVQSANTLRATQYIALSHSRNASLPFLYTAFTQNDAIGNNYVYHKNHDLMVNSFWRVTNQSTANSEPDMISVSPNPFNDKLNLKSNTKLSASLYDVTGRYLGTYSGTADEVNNKLNEKTGTLVAGTYLLNTRSKSGNKKMFKLAKQ